MAGIRENSQIVKGSALMAFIGGAPVGFATSHSLSLSTNTTEVNTKDHGDYPSVIVQNITWEVTAENLYSDAGEATYMTALVNKTPITIQFAKVNYATDEKGVIGPNGHAEWTSTDVIAEGQAIVTSYSINAAAGDNATMSVTFTGMGALTTNVDGNSGPQGPQG